MKYPIYACSALISTLIVTTTSYAMEKGPENLTITRYSLQRDKRLTTKLLLLEKSRSIPRINYHESPPTSKFKEADEKTPLFQKTDVSIRSKDLSYRSFT
jgi:hypothetical protein